MKMGETILKMRGIQKYFSGVHALKGVDFELRAGEVHALMGENGASVIAQSVEPGTMVPKGTVITLTFRYLEGDEDRDFMN